MGINGLFSFLKKKFPSLFETVHFSQFRGKSFAIDVSGLIWKFKVVNPTKWLDSFAYFIFALRQNQIHPIFVYDGKAPVEKEKEKLRRNEQRVKLINKTEQLREDLDKYYNEGEASELLLEKSKELKPNTLANVVQTQLLEQKYQQMKTQINNFTDEDRKKLQQLFDLAGVPTVTSPSEAETLCASLYHEKKVDAVVSGDSDVCAYQVENFLYEINHFNHTAIKVSFSRLLQALELTPTQFVDFCILCGTDYNDNIPKVGPVNAYKLIKECGSIEKIGEKGYDISILNHQVVRGLFQPRHSVSVETVCRAPNTVELYNFLVMNNSRISFETIQKAYAPPVLIFE